MADRYWRGGTGTWNNSNTTNWSTTSGGAGGASVPTSADDVFFDANSGSGNVNVTRDRPCKNLTIDGFAGTIQFNNDVNNRLFIYGNISLGAGTNISSGNSIFQLTGTAAQTITTNGTTIPRLSFAKTDGSGSVTLLDDLSVGSVEMNGSNTNVTFSTGGFDINASDLFSLTLGLGTFDFSGSTITSGGGVTISSLIGTVVSTNSSIILTSSAAGITTFAGSGHTYDKVIFNRGANTNANQITGNNTINELHDLGTAAHILQFGNNSTQTINLFNVNGSSGNLITIRPATNSGANRANFTKSGGGIISCDYLNIVRSNASPGSTWYAGANSTDGGNNTGWIFADAPTFNPAIARRRLLARR